MVKLSRIGILGMGAMGQAVLQALQQELPAAEFAFLEREHRLAWLSQQTAATGFSEMAALLAWEPQVVIECAGHSAVQEQVPQALRAGVDVVVASLGALSNDQLHQELQHSAEESGARLTLVCGALGGLDALRAGMLAGVESVTYDGRKPPAAWQGSPAEALVDLNTLSDEQVFFEGSAREAAQQFPKNANVTAAAALAGVGFDDTVVRLIADPSADANSHTLHVSGPSGAFSITLSNNPLPQNPKTSWLAALSVQEAVLRRTAPISF